LNNFSVNFKEKATVSAPSVDILHKYLHSLSPKKLAKKTAVLKTEDYLPSLTIKLNDF